MAEVAALGLKVEGTEGIDRAATALGGLTQASDKAEKATAGVGKSSEKANKTVDDLAKAARNSGSGFALMGAAAISLGVVLATAFSISAIRRYADTWSDMQSTVGASLGDMNAAAGAMSRIVEIANASYSPLQQTVGVYSRNVAAFRDLGRGSKEAADFTESLNLALVTTATRGQDADVVVGSLSRSLATGKLDAQAFDTIVSRSPRVLKAMADEMGVTTSELRALAVAGKVTSTVIADGMVKSLEQLREEAALMPATLTDAFVRVNNNITEFVGRIDKASGASSAMADVILGFADGIRRAGDYVIAFGVWAKPAFDLVGAGLSMIGQYADIALAAVAGFAAPALIAGVGLLASAIGVGLVAAIRAVTAAMLANPLGLLIAGISAALYAVYKFRDEIQNIIGVNVVQVCRDAANRIIGAFVGAYELITFYWSNFPQIIAGVMVSAVNLYIRYINTLVDTAKSAINTVIDLANNVPGISLSSAGGAWGISEIDNPYAEMANKAANDAVEAAKKAFGKDWLAAAFDGFNMPETTVFVDGGGGKAPKAPIDPKAAKAAADAIKANADAVKNLEQALYLAAFRGEQLAVEQAKLSLNKAATPEQVKLVEELARGIYKLTEAEKQRQKFGENSKEADKYILGDVNPLSGGKFDNQIARYDAEAVKENERYAEQLERLTLARELKIATIKSYDELEQEAAKQNADRLAQIEQAKTSIMLQGASKGFGALADIMKASQGEQSSIYRAMFAVSKAFAVADATMNAYTAISKAWASAPFPANLAAVAATTPQVLAVVSAVQGTGLKGMAHSGIDSVPESGTWLLEKGERVTTANTSAKLDAVLSRIDSRQRGSGTVINIIENKDKAGKTESRTNDYGEEETDIFVSDIYGGGKRAQAMQDVYGLRRVGT